MDANGPKHLLTTVSQAILPRVVSVHLVTASGGRLAYRNEAAFKCRPTECSGQIPSLLANSASITEVSISINEA